MLTIADIKMLNEHLFAVKAAGCYNCMVAGGYFRDIYLNRTPKDIDIFYVGEIKAFNHPRIGGVEWKDLSNLTDPSYNGEPLLQLGVAEIIGSSLPVNLISVRSLWKLKQNFGADINMVYYSLEFGLEINPQFFVATELNHITFSPDVRPAYKAKLVSYFPTYTFTTKLD